eukprot:SAG31_NODE_164_length_21790_cov_26.291411_5_plen_81_part_00
MLVVVYLLVFVGIGLPFCSLKLIASLAASSWLAIVLLGTRCVRTLNATAGLFELQGVYVAAGGYHSHCKWLLEADLKFWR